MRKKVGLLCSVFIVILLFSVQVNAYDTSPASQKADLDYIVDCLSEMHPDTVDGFNEEQKAAVDKAYSKLNGSSSGWDFAFTVKELLTSFHDGHTNIYPKDITTDFYNIPNLWLKDGIVVTDDTDVLKKGDIITRIGGKTPDEILETLLKFEPNENKYTIMGNSGYFLMFKPYHDICGCTSKDGKETIEYIRDNEKKTAEISASPTVPSKEDNSENKWYGSKVFDNLSLAVFYLDEFKENDEFKTAITNFFKEVKSKNIKNVAIDLRGNDGGDVSAINEILKYLNIEGLPRDSGTIVRVSQKALDNSDYYNDDYSKPQVIKDFTRLKSITYYHNQKVTDGNIFKGNFYVLTSNYSFSAASLFAWLVKYSNAGLIIGEPTGNNPNHTYGNPVRLVLPNTGFTFYISTLKFTNFGTEDTVMPSIPVYISPDDVKKENDPHVQKLFELVKTKSYTWQNYALKDAVMIGSETCSSYFNKRFPINYTLIEPNTESGIPLENKEIVFLSRYRSKFTPLTNNAPDILKQMDGRTGNYLDIRDGDDGRLYICIHAQSLSKYKEIVDKMDDDFSPKYINFDIEQNSIKIVYKGKRLYPDVYPVIKEGRTLVPMRFIFEAMGLSVNWDASAQTVTGSKDGKRITIHINDKTAYVDGKASVLDAPATVIDGRTMVPVRFIAESTGAVVDWSQDTKTVNIK